MAIDDNAKYTTAEWRAKALIFDHSERDLCIAHSSGVYTLIRTEYDQPYYYRCDGHSGRFFVIVCFFSQRSLCISTLGLQAIEAFEAKDID